MASPAVVTIGLTGDMNIPERDCRQRGKKVEKKTIKKRRTGGRTDEGMVVLRLLVW